MKIFLIGIAAVVIIAIIKSCSSGSQKKETTVDSSQLRKHGPGQEKNNDKLVLVSNAGYADLKNVLTDFCKMYNEDSIVAMPRLIKITDREFAITFPYDIEFERYCYFVNYLKYPKDIKYDPNILAWTTTKPLDNWITEKSAGKNVMLFIPNDDSEYDNIFLTTDDNIGYKLGFATGEEKQLLKVPKQRYTPPSTNLNNLPTLPSEDFQ